VRITLSMQEGGRTRGEGSCRVSCGHSRKVGLYEKDQFLQRRHGREKGGEKDENYTLKYRGDRRGKFER